MRIGVLAAVLAAAVLALAGCAADEPVDVRERAISLGAKALSQNLAVFAEEGESVFDSIEEVFSGGASPGIAASPEVAGGVGGTDLSGGVGGPALSGGVGSPSTGVGGVSAGPSSVAGGDVALAGAICRFFNSLCGYIGRCAGAADADAVCGEFASPACTSAVAQVLREAGIGSVPPEALQVLDCTSSRIATAPCMPTEEELQVLVSSIQECLPPGFVLPQEEPPPSAAVLR